MGIICGRVSEGTPPKRNPRENTGEISKIILSRVAGENFERIPIEVCDGIVQKNAERIPEKFLRRMPEETGGRAPEEIFLKILMKSL